MRIVLISSDVNYPSLGWVAQKEERGKTDTEDISPGT
jgi:hypothetical protein